MIYLSSNKQRKRRVKDICKKYKELPPYVIKQIIDYELSKEKKFSLHYAISEVRVLNERITIYKNGVEAAIKNKKLINNCDIYECPVFIDLGNGYCSRMTINEAIDKLEFYRKIRRETIEDVRYDHMIKKYITPFQREGKIMFGLRFNSVCPYCNNKHFVSLGASTQYFTLNNSEFDYTKIKCSECTKEYWLSHAGEEFRDAKKINEDDKLERTKIVCW